MGTQSARIMYMVKIPEEETNNYEYAMNLIAKYKEGETFEHFLTDCKHLVRSGNYNEIDPQESQEHKAHRAKIVMGIRVPGTGEVLLRVDKLTLEKKIQRCRTTEQSKTQN
ncbi:hypothetical protein QE152_g40545, partial [Popillia japonica]